MNKQDIILASALVVLVSIIYLILNITNNNETNNAYVYYDDELVLTIDLTDEIKEYVVEGYNGPVTITAGEGKIKVEDEESPLHLCSKQGYISKSYESIICLPNKIVITLGNEEELDAVVK